ncbi:MAG: ABC transporter ATP-binding protein [Acidobacteriota bacterium]|nr:ABC transporter ATP-binding protein [Acidobacteriota bacterium]
MSSQPEHPRVETRALSRRYGRHRALADVSLTCRGGEAIALVGPNGAGKSTLLTLLSTLARPTSGQILYDGRHAQACGLELRRRMGVLGHDVSLYPELTARENLTFFAKLFGVSDCGDRVRDALAASGLSARADDPAGTFSRGMRQRLAIERALLHAPDVLLFDEPFTGLDEHAAEALVCRLETARAHGASVIFSSHDFEHAERVASRVAMLDAGRLTWLDGTGPLRDRYRAAAAGARA